MKRLRIWSKHKREGNINFENVSPIVISELKKRKYKAIDYLGSGSFAVVLRLQNKKDKSEVAAKIVKKDMINANEDEFWPLFRHPNILCLHEIINLKDFNVYLMPCMERTLGDAFLDSYQTSCSDAFSQLKSCFMDVLRGLEYLHGLQFCYIDLKSNNVLLDSNMKAVICDFSWCLPAVDLVRCSFGSNYLMPPEGCTPHGTLLEFDGLAYDIWTFGLLVFVLLTGSLTDVKYGKLYVENWDDQLFDLFYILLQEQIFVNFVQCIFGKNELLPSSDLRLALNLIKACMRKLPEDRPKISTLFQHGLWSGEPDKTLEEDIMWLDDCDISEIDQDIKDHKSVYTALQAHIENLKHEKRKEICHDLLFNLRRYFIPRSYHEVPNSKQIHSIKELLMKSGFSSNLSNFTFYDYNSGKYIKLSGDSPCPVNGIEKLLLEKLQIGEALQYIDDEDDKVSKSSDVKDDHVPETSNVKDDHVPETSNIKDDHVPETSDVKDNLVPEFFNKKDDYDSETFLTQHQAMYARERHEPFKANLKSLVDSYH